MEEEGLKPKKNLPKDQDKKKEWVCNHCQFKNFYDTPKCTHCQAMRKRKLLDYGIPIIPRHEILSGMKLIRTLRVRALYCMLYLTGARISEIVRTIKPSDIEVQDLDGKTIIYIHNIPVLKRRKKIVRSVPIIYDLEKDFADPILKYALLVTEGQGDKYPLFMFNRFTAYKFLRHIRFTGFEEGVFCHWFRHQRISHLRTFYNFDIFELKDFTKHSKADNLEFYVHLSSSDLARKMIQKSK